MSKPKAVIPPLIPHPSALIESMRNIGYRPHIALADLVDNSITAKSRNVQIEVCPSGMGREGWIRVEDDGEGMTAEELLNAMRWGGDGPLAQRKANDLGRFGLGLKTASFSMGRQLTVASRKRGKLHFLRWDLDHISKTGRWELQEGVAPKDEAYLKNEGSEILSGDKDGTIILITKVDKLSIDGHSEKQCQTNKTALIRTIQNHLGLVFHRFLEKKALKLKLGTAIIQGWNLFGTTGVGEDVSWLKSTEMLANGSVRVRTFVLPHYKTLTDEQHDRLGGPLGWNAHQGFLIYRADRLIVPGGWLGFFRPEEHYKLARIAVDIPNALDERWGLDVIKSKVSPPAILKGDMERIAGAARKGASDAYRFHGDREAPETNSGENAPLHAFWKQISGKREVVFRINRGHPLVEALFQATTSKSDADAFLHAFERLLPVAAILQQPSKSTHGLAVEPSGDEIEKLASALQLAVEIFVKSGFSPDEAVEAALSCQPFSAFRTTLASKLNTP